jgi:hypothetical protein
MKLYAVPLAILLAMFSAHINADKFYWLIGDLSKIKVNDTAKSEKYLAKVPKGAILEIPVAWTAPLCDFNKNIVTYEDKLKRYIAVCAYIGEIREY